MKKFSSSILQTLMMGFVIQSMTSLTPSFAKTPIRSKEVAKVAPQVEPSYCDPAFFDETETSVGPDYEEQQKKSLIRLHGYKLGKVKLVGVGVGNSSPASLIEIAKNNTNENIHKSLEAKKYCTFYLNHPKKETDLSRVEAVAKFNHRDVPKNPIHMTEQEASQEFMSRLEKVFAQDQTSFLSCAAEQNYIALGCNGMAHRGPTVFGMLLAYSGCSAEHSLEITNQIWGLNGVKRKVRLAIIRKAYELGNTQKESRKRLAELFSAK